MTEHTHGAHPTVKNLKLAEEIIVRVREEGSSNEGLPKRNVVQLVAGIFSPVYMLSLRLEPQ